MAKWFENPNRIIGGDPDTIDLEVSYIPDGKLYVSRTWRTEEDEIRYLRRQPSIGIEEVVECPDLLYPMLIWIGAMALHAGFEGEIVDQLRKLACWALDQKKKE